jgi:hypothetical protein
LGQLFDSQTEDWVVQQVSADSCGGFRLDFRNGLWMDVFPGDSLGDEFWRLLQPAKETDHFVVTGEGINQDD